MDEISVEVKIYERGSLKAFADVTIQTAMGEMTLKGFHVIKKEGQPEWVAFPSSSYVKDGKKVNNQFLEVSKTVKKKLVDAIMAQFEKAMERV
jgi:DNA-binding cell septation regulator SpoVG